jgi:hypothetical protein
MRAELFHVDGRRDTKLVAAFRSFANTPWICDLSCFNPEDEGSGLFRNSGTYVPNATMQHPEQPWSLLRTSCNVFADVLLKIPSFRDYFDYWTGHYVAPKHVDPTILWHGVTSRKNGMLMRIRLTVWGICSGVGSIVTLVTNFNTLRHNVLAHEKFPVRTYPALTLACKYKNFWYALTPP